MNNKFLTYLRLLYSRHWQALSSTEKSEGQKWEINAALSMPYFFKSLRQRSISVTACNYVILKQFKLSYFMGIDSAVRIYDTGDLCTIYCLVDSC